MAIEYSVEFPIVEAYKELFDSTGWNKRLRLSSDELDRALRQSWSVVCAFDADRLVGFGRVVSDSMLYAMIYDLIVAPTYRRRGIGSAILQRLTDRCLEAGIREVQLFPAAGKSGFYQSRGFEIRPADAPGMRLIKK